MVFRKLSILMLALLLFSCAEKLDLSQFPEIAVTDERRIEYLPVFPEWTGFSRPQDVHVGYDDLVYVADTENDRIVMLDVNGTVLGYSQRIRRPVAVTQDRRLDLLVAARYDTVVSNTPLQLAAIYRLRMYQVSHDIAQAAPEPVVIHPRYVLGKTLRISDSAVAFTGVATMYDNEYYVTRRGPENISLIQPGGPDNNILRFSPTDNLISPLTSYLTATGTGKASANDLTGITTYAVPPQRATVDQRRSFVVTLKGENSFRVQGMLYFESREDVGYTPDPAFEGIDTTQARRFLYDFDPTDAFLGGGFVEPQDVTYAADTRYVFVVDAGRDSVYQYAANGYEGIRPPPYSTERKNIIVSFGGTGRGPTQFRNPHGIAYYQPGKILLVADTGNNRIVRFRLSTDFD